MAHETAVTRFFRLECLCDGCELREGGNREPDYLELKGYVIGDEGEIIGQALVSGADYERTVGFSGIPKPKNILKGFNGCEGPEIYEDRIVCGAIANISRRNRDGREEI
ncbi:hypothetical protein KW792_01410 [Candidatus Saccharibacteria bacterium]|nr:hypothetical protein [Candidatus Saccharibacteria bacterium]